MQEVFNTFSAVLSSADLDVGARKAFVFAAWKRIAGELLYEHAVPVRLEVSILSVAVSNRAWQKHLTDLCRQMLFRLNEIVGSGTVTRIEFVVDEGAVTADRNPRPRSEDDDAFNALAENEMSGELRRAAEAIEDEGLRNAFLLAAGRCLVRRNAHIKHGAR